MATADLQDLRDIFYWILREEQSESSAYPLILCDQYLNSAQMKICDGKVVNPLSRQVISKWQLPFLFKEVFYSNIQNTSLTIDTTIWATTLNVADTTNFPTTWTLFIAGNIIPYTGKTLTTFTGCSDVLFAFQWWQSVDFAFTLPEDFSKALNLVYNNRFEMEMKLYDNIYEDLNAYKGTNWQNNRGTDPYNSQYRINPFYTIKDNQYLLIYQMYNTWDIIKLRYEKLPTEMVDDTDESTIPNSIYAKGTIPYLAVAEMLFNRGEESRAAEIINFACWQITEMYSHYNDTMYQDPSGKQYKSGKSGRRINI